MRQLALWNEPTQVNEADVLQQYVALKQIADDFHQDMLNFIMQHGKRRRFEREIEIYEQLQAFWSEYSDVLKAHEVIWCDFDSEGIMPCYIHTVLGSDYYILSRMGEDDGEEDGRALVQALCEELPDDVL